MEDNGASSYHRFFAERREKMRNAKKVIRVTAGCLMILLAVGIPVTNLFLSSKDDDLLIENNISNIQADASSSIRKEMMQDNSVDIEDINGELQKEETCIDVPVSINPGSTGALVPYEAVWGGSYPDETGAMGCFADREYSGKPGKGFCIKSFLNRE